MTAIVMNTLTGAVTEYDWAFKSLTATRAADDAGLYTQGGDTDNGAAIVAEMRGRKAGGEKMQSVSTVYFTLQGPIAGVAIVQGNTAAWEFPVEARPGGVCAADTAKGIREVYLGFGFRNAAGADFRIDRIDADVAVSNYRRS